MYLEALAMQPKGDTSSEKTGHPPCVIRAGFYAEKLLLYAKEAQGQGKLRLPVGEDQKLAPVALGDVAQISACMVTSEDPQGLADDVRGQVIVSTGAYWGIAMGTGASGVDIASGLQLTAGPELAEAASQALGTKMELESIDEYFPPTNSLLPQYR